MRASFFVLAAIVVISCGEATVRHEYNPCEADDDCPGSAVCEDGICVEYISVPASEESESEAESEGEVDCGAGTECGSDNDCSHLNGECLEFFCGGDCCFAGYVDRDKDGWYCDGDCADHDPEIHPEAIETCDGVDNNCDGEVDELPDPGDPELVWCGGEVGVCVDAYVTCLKDGSFYCIMPPPYSTVELNCNDALDNDCDGETDCADADCTQECETACATITTPDGEMVEVSGAPRFALHPASPSGATVSDLGEVLRFTVEVEEGCSAVWIYSLAVQVAFTDNAGSGWAPAIMRLYWDQPDEIMMSQAAWGVLETAGNLRYDFAIEPGNMFIEPGLHNMRVTLETVGASAAFDDTIRASLVGPVEFITLEDGARWEMVFDPVVGGTLIF